MKKLPYNVQTLFSASNRIHSYKRAIEELVYNALDAKSSSIAIRLNLEDQTIQVIDNGCGINETDMKAVGQKYMTSKLVDKSTFKSTSDNYGYGGQMLASIIEVSEKVEITSRCNNHDTIMKTFNQGTEYNVCITDVRPSKGTTVAIRGFLYNLNIQKQNIDPVVEIQEIKMFLEQLSLVHSNVSISLRDDSNNEIIFKVHKSRDIYQRLKSLFGIKEEHCMEMKVEKNSYKVTAYIGKTISEDNENHWIYLNGRYMKYCKLNKVFDEEMFKVLNFRKSDNKNVKKMFDHQNDDNKIFRKKIPFYFLFITCPYMDYDLNNTESKTFLEFRKWDNVSNLLKKLANFYIRDGHTENKNSKKAEEQSSDAVKKIVEKFLGHNFKKPDVSQMQNGIKGPMMKRNKKKKNTINLSNIIQDKIKNTRQLSSKDLNGSYKQMSSKILHDQQRTANKAEKIFTETKKRNFKTKPDKKINKSKVKNNIDPNIAKIKKIKSKNELVRAFEINNSQIQRKCKLAAEKANMLLCNKYRRIGKIVNDTVNYSSIRTNIKPISIRKQICKDIASETSIFRVPVIQNRTKKEAVIQKHRTKEHEKECCKSSYDLLQTIFKTQSINQNVNTLSEIQFGYSEVDEHDVTEENRLTYQSHHYNVEERYVTKDKKIQTKGNRFFTSKSIDDFAFGHVFRKQKQKRKPHPYSKWYGKRSVFNYEHEKSYTIEFTDSNKLDYLDIISKEPESSVSIDNSFLHSVISQLPAGNTYSVTNTIRTVRETTRKFNETVIDENIDENHETYTVDIHDTFQDNDDIGHIRGIKDNNYNEINVEFISNTQTSANKMNDSLALEPLNICETLFNESNHDDEHLFSKQFDYDVNNASDHFERQIDSIDVPDNQQNDNIAMPVEVPSVIDLLDETSHHFQQTIEDEIQRDFAYTMVEDKITKSKDVSIESFKKSGVDYRLHKKTGMTFGRDKQFEMRDFKLRDRRRFMPKGLSPILEKCNTKNACNYDLESEYFNHSMYNDFAKEIKVNTEIYEANVQNVKDMATKHIEKVNDKLKKDNASLGFDGTCLKEAKVLGQVDSKFIAAKMPSDTGSEHLVLFDQHAVHERIRLEDNMSEYLTNGQWKSISLDEILIKLKQDELIYLHNYKEKFAQLGLKWTMLRDTEITISEIPHAILGKNTRKLELIMRAVKSLIQEEIIALKLQKGSLSLYPKSIMDLVFSEACRYAIKFGDNLSVKECSKLLLDLSKCKTPFQCAHGRPVMAVLLDIAPKCPNYKFNMDKLKSFKDKSRKNNQLNG